MEDAADKRLSVGEFVSEAGFGDAVSGYVYQTVPVAIYAWIRHSGDFRTTMTAVLNCGGDTDTVGAIAGALAGCVVGEEGIPEEWIDGLWEWPRGKKVMVKIADSLVKSVCGEKVKQVSCYWPGLALRNILFILVIFGHLFLRVLPVRFRRLLRL